MIKYLGVWFDISLGSPNTMNELNYDNKMLSSRGKIIY